ncbi:MAG TPA: DUF4430 domain-containing protein [Solirubrobacterales bacterium]|nr:DUF4430 domain-containing protein [Solirubrobacterales bacterium]
MTRVGGLAAAAALCAAAVAGCGLGPGSDDGEVALTVTRDYGTELLERATESITESDTVLRLLDRNAEVETRYGGGFIQSIDGIAGGENDGRRTDWFFYVNGVESSVGSAEYDPSDGDRIWWDHHDWTSAMRVPAVVGSWPEPFVHGFEGQRWKVDVSCKTVLEVCEIVEERLRGAGAEPSEVSPEEAIRVEVGSWEEIRTEEDVRPLAGPPSESGVFATFTDERRPLLTLLNDRGEPAGSLGRGAGLIAALRPGDGPPTWVITGTDQAGVEAAAGLLGDDLRDRFAVATYGAGCKGVRRGDPCHLGVPVR